MKTKRANGILTIISTVFSTVGILMLVGGLLLLISDIQFKERAVEIPGVITDIMSYRDSDGDKHHSVSVTYQYGGKVYEDVEIGSYSSSMYEGKEITLLCDPDRPGKVQVSSMYLTGALILMCMGVIFAAVGISLIVANIRAKMRYKKLLETGKTIYATVEKIAYNQSYSVNGDHPFVIYCEYKDDYKDVIYKFKSDNLWTNPSDVFPVGSTIEVLVNPNNYSFYHVCAEDVDKKIMDFT